MAKVVGDIVEIEPAEKHYEFRVVNNAGIGVNYVVKDYGFLAIVETAKGVYIGNLFGHDEDRVVGDAIDTHINHYVETYL